MRSEFDSEDGLLDLNTPEYQRTSRVCEPTHDFEELGILQYSKYKQLQILFVFKNIRSRVAMLLSCSWNSVCIFLNTNMCYVLLNVYAFGSFLCFGLIGFPFHMRSILRSIHADYRSLLFDKRPSQSFLGLCNALLREGTHEEALRTSSWTTFCLVQLYEGRL